ncbi:hypothetical protein BH11ACT3_BH11ACT3_11530 [soil metagenome]
MTDIALAARWSRSGIAGLMILALLTPLLLIGRTITVALTYQAGSVSGISDPLGVLGLLFIVPVVIAVVLGHVGLSHTADGARRGRLLAALTLGAGYLHVALWANRIVDAVVSTIAGGDPSQFIANVFLWA